MPNLHYPWKRFWFPIKEILQVDEYGFLHDPEDEVMQYANKEIVTLEELDDIHSLALLGEPGVGKTSTLKEEIVQLETATQNTPDQVLSLDLNEYGEETRLVTDLFGSPIYQEWLSGEHKLYLMLDSLDECRIQIPQVATIIVSRLRRITTALDRLCLRIACRTSEWSHDLWESLPDIFGEDGHRVLELTPIRRRDVTQALQMNNINPDDFMESLFSAEALPLATRPNTLNFLINVFLDQGELPSSKVELYEIGCQVLCKEHNRIRRDLGGAGNLTHHQRLAIASRIAAVFLFSRKTIIASDPPVGEIDRETLSIHDLVGGTEPYDSGDVEVSDQAILETLGTALFTGCGHDLFTFTHRSYVEFLASRYLESNQTDSERIKALLIHPDDPEQKIIPQLYEVAAWIASWNSNILDFIAENEPRVLLSSDPELFTDDDKQVILNSYLTQIESGEEKPEYEQWHFYPKLSYQSMADQLTAWISDRSKEQITRREAIRYAYLCKVTEVQVLLSDIALDESEDLDIRSIAARGVSLIGDDDRRSRLSALASGNLVEDVNDDLKGDVLRALWPNILTAEELFDCLSIPKVRHYTGSYGMFVGWELVDHLQPSDLQPALEWVLRTQDTDNLSFELLSDEIIARAWDNLQNAEVFTAFLNILGSRFSVYKPLLSQNSTRSSYQADFDDPEKRHRIITAIVENADLYEHVDGHTLRSQWPHLLKGDDIVWLDEQIKDDQSPEVRSRLSELIWSIFDTEDSDHASIVIETSEVVAELRARFHHDLETVEIGSAQAETLQERYERFHTVPQYDVPLNEGPNQEERISTLLQRIEAGEIDAWVLMPVNLAVVNVGENVVPPSGPDITVLPGWINASQETQNQNVKSAIKYLQEGTADPTSWLGTRQFTVYDLAPYQAFFLIWKHFPTLLTSIDIEIWKKWGAYFLCDVNTGDESEKNQEFVAEAYKHAPGEIIEALSLIIRQEHARNGSVTKLDRVENCGDHQMCSALFEQLDEITSNPTLWRQVLQFMIENNYQPAIELAQTYLTPPYPAEDPERTLAVAAIVTLFIGKSDTWDSIWSEISTDEQFAHDVLAEYVNMIRWFHTNAIYEQSEMSLASLFIWLTTKFPYEENPLIPDGADFATTAGGLKEIRDRILTILTTRGTHNALLALQHIGDEMPQLEFISRCQVGARRALLDNSWIPISPRELINTTKDPRFKLVRTESELQGLIMDILDKMDRYLQGDTAAAQDVWDGRRPKDEPRYSNWLKRNLELRTDRMNIVLDREVLMRQNEGGRTGELIDILATAPTELGRVKVIIEVKGCWHRDVLTAMETQLVDRYLLDNQCQHGIYLVGWFMCDQWEEENRKNRTPNMTLEEARTFFANQADGLTNDNQTIKAFVMNTALR